MAALGINLRVRGRLSDWVAAHRTLPSVWRLSKSALSEYRRNFWTLAGIVLLILVPSSLISIYVVTPGEDSSLQAYLTLANSLMNTALVLAIVKLGKKQAVSINQAYYQGSALLVRLLLLTVLFFVMLLPLLTGILIFSAGILDPEGLLSIYEKIMLALLAIIFAIPSLTMLTRAVFSFYVVAESDMGPWQAIRASRQLVRGRALAVFGRLVGLTVATLLAIALPTAGLIWLSAGLQTTWPTLILQILIGLMVLPFTNLYLYRLYQDLS